MFKLLTLVLLVVSSLFLVQFAFSSHGACKAGFEEFVTERGTACRSIAESQAIGISTPQIEFDYADYQEHIQLIVDQRNIATKTSVVFLSKNPQDLLIDPVLEERIFNTDRIASIKITNEFNCGISQMVMDPDLGCVFIGVKREGLVSDIVIIREEARKVADSLMYQDPNDLTNTGMLTLPTKFHSVLLGTKIATEVSEEEELVKYGSENIATVIYTIKRHPTQKMFSVFDAFIIDERISTSGGFIKTAKEIMRQSPEYSSFNLVLRVDEQEIVREITVSFEKNVLKEKIESEINVLDLIQVDNIRRSDIFSDGFFPLNSVIQVLIMGDENLQVKRVNPDIKEKIETIDDLIEDGWFFISKSGYEIDGRYLFGQKSFVTKDDLILSIGPYSGTDEMIQVGGGGCLIATAAFGSEMSPQVQFLREIRDNTVLQTESGTSFMTGFNQFYYSFSPVIADYERENPVFKEVVKITLTPLLTSLTLLQYADIDSESDMLGYGIGIILLNIGMYFVAPAVLIMKIRKRIYNNLF